MHRLLRSVIPLVLLFVALAAACQPTPAPPPTVIPPPPPPVLTEVAETLTAVAPTAPGSATPIPPPVGTTTPFPPPTGAPGEPTATPVTPEPNPPTVQLLSPLPNSQVTANQPISVVAFAADDQGIARVELYADNALFATQAPPAGNLPQTYQAVFPWHSNTVGAHTLFVIAYDPSNNPSVPQTVSLTITPNNTPPSVQILAPTTPQTLNLGAQLRVQVVANDEAGVTRLEMFVDNQIYSQTASPNPNGTTPFAATFIYAANSPGSHALVIRATDAAGNIANTNPLQVTVNDTSAPTVSTTFNRPTIQVLEQLIVTTTAVDPAGIQRVELWADNALYNLYQTPNPAAQTSLSINQFWTSNTPGNHQLFVRVFDTNGQSTTTPATNIFVSHPQAPTPTFPPIPPTWTPWPTRPPTAPPPPLPNINMLAPPTNYQVTLPQPLRIVVDFRSDVGLRQLELFAQYSGTMATPIHVEDANGARNHRIQFDWHPPAPGLVLIYATAVDVLGQYSEGPHIPGVVHPQAPPTIAPPPTRAPTPPPPPTRAQSIAGRWRGQVDNGVFIINLEPRIGCSETSCAWGGRFQDQRGGTVVSGELNGQLNGNSLTLEVQGAQPGDVTWSFQGEVTAGGREIVGQWTESRAGVMGLQRGSVSFRR